MPTHWIENPDDFQNFTPLEIATYVEENNLNYADTNYVISEWVRVKTNRAQRTFNYTQAFPAQDTDCTTGFTRTFAHQDWVDGESVVQAEQTSMEDGFNLRFHNIEKDIDGLSAEIAQAFVCLAEMRSSLSALLLEIRAEINRLNKDVFDCCQGEPEVRPGVYVPPAGVLLGVTDYHELPYQIYQLEDKSIQMFPIEVDPPPIERFIPDYRAIDDRVRGGLTDFVRNYAENERVRVLFEEHPEGITKQDIIDVLGPTSPDTGVNIEDIVNVLPTDDTRYANFEGLVDALSGGAANTIRSVGRTGAVGARLGVGRDVLRVEDAPIERVGGVSVKLGNALKANGVSTLADVNKLEVGDLLRIFSDNSIEATAGDAMALKANVSTLLRL